MNKQVFLTAMILALALPAAGMSQTNQGGNGGAPPQFGGPPPNNGGFQGGERGNPQEEAARLQEHKAEILRRMNEHLAEAKQHVAEIEQRERCVEAAANREALMACMPQRGEQRMGMNEGGERQGFGGGQGQGNGGPPKAQ